MLLILIALILAAAAYVIVARRQSNSGLLETQTKRHVDGENLRPLFAPDNEELRALERAEEESANAQAVENARLDAEKALARFEEFRQTWRESPGRTNTVELLVRAAELGSSETYLETVNELLHKRSDAFNDDELAQLIESHFWLLPQSERTPGVTFTINRELAALRGRAQAISDEEASDA